MTRRTSSVGAAVTELGRRRFITMGAAAAALAGLGTLTPAVAQTKAKAKPAPAAAPTPNKAIVDAAKDCIAKGTVCERHCVRLIAAGDKSVADCLRTVRSMLPTCTATRRIATIDGKRLKELAKICRDVCSDCEAECRKHEFHHKECKACAESCAAMIKACDALIAA